MTKYLTAEQIKQDDRLMDDLKTFIKAAKQGQIYALCSNANKQNSKRDIKLYCLVNIPSHGRKMYVLSDLLSHVMHAPINGDYSCRVTGGGMDMIFKCYYELLKTAHEVGIIRESTFKNLTNKHINRMNSSFNTSMRNLEGKKVQFDYKVSRGKMYFTQLCEYFGD